jgi:hypothetical protein
MSSRWYVEGQIIVILTIVNSGFDNWIRSVRYKWAFWNADFNILKEGDLQMLDNSAGKLFFQH